MTPAPKPSIPPRVLDDLPEAFRRIRATTEALCAGLQPEDTVAQSMPDASPTKWHLAHTSWFFEKFALPEVELRLSRDVGGWGDLFNSYYQSVGGEIYPRADRGVLTRPTLAEIVAYRHRVDEAVTAALTSGGSIRLREIVEIGLNHEQQHQELILTDLKHLLSKNPLSPRYRAPPFAARPSVRVPLRYLRGFTGIHEIGAGDDGFRFDNETPSHPVLLHPHAIANRPVNNTEFRAFIEDGGYRRPELWLSDGWAAVRTRGWQRPLYWHEDLAHAFTLSGMADLHPLAPVCHVSYFEADAYARWAEARLPTEQEWEAMAQSMDSQGNFADSGHLHPQPPPSGTGPLQVFGDVWEWTSSAYGPYPGFRPLGGSLGEYNGKFMSGQMVLRGGSCATPAGHVRSSYRNFFYPADRWQFGGLRLARDA